MTEELPPLKCPICGRERHIQYDLSPSLQEKLDLPHKRHDWPCLECLVKLAQNKGIKLDLASFYFLGSDDGAWINEGDGDALGQIEALLDRLTRPGATAAQVTGELFPYDMGMLHIRWTFTAEWVEDPDEPD